MTTTPWNPHLFQVTQSGYPYPQQVSLTHRRRGNGLVKGPVTIEICDRKCTKVVHSNQLQHHYVPGQRDTTNTTNKIDHLERTSPSVEHVILLTIEQNVSNHYLQRQRRPPGHY